MFSQQSEEDARITAVGIDEKGNREPVVTVLREEVEAITLLPLLPYIFFEKNESDLQLGRYKKLTATEAKYFNENSLQTSITPLYAYRYILNIVGKRLKDNLADTMQIIGCTDGIEPDTLGYLRAKTIQDYFVSVWLIGVERLPIIARKLPEKPSITAQMEYTEQSNAENRRVEFVADWRILRPVEIRDIQIRMTPSQIEFQLDYEHREKIVRHSMKAWQLAEDSILFSREGTEMPLTYLWNIEEDVEHQPKTEQQIEFRLFTTDNTNRQQASTIGNIQVEQQTLFKKKTLKIAGKELHRFNLILFDFGSNALTDYHKRIVEIIYEKGRLLSSSKVTVSGYADEIGDDERNRLRSVARAESITEYLMQRYKELIKPESIRSIGNGEKDLFKDEWKTPESRMYCRTVQIEIENSISNK
jgi:outer membrane protein OmpA-like peptidoglycan-associated protein